MQQCHDEQEHTIAYILACGISFFLLQLSTVIGAAIPEERHEGKWIEGIAIWVAIFLVTFVSEWRCLILAVHLLSSAWEYIPKLPSKAFFALFYLSPVP
jgi:hypothetical protein